ncbi:MAG: HU family DNA-binding protein [Deltaproteobacteria bacterium]
MEGYVNRTELIEAISGHTGLTPKQSEAALSAVVYEITAGVRAGSPVRITGFGSFKLRQRAARRGRNPQTGAPVKVKASKGIGFTPGVRLKADLNSRSAPVKPAALTVPAKKAGAAAVVARKAAPAKKAPAKAAAVKKTTVAEKVVAKRSAALSR